MQRARPDGPCRPVRHLVAGGLVALVSAAAVLAEPQRPAFPASDGGTVRHVLERLTFGPRPDDAARVKAMGLEDFIDQQLHPERIDDRALASRLDAFDTLDLSSSELAERYILPALEARRQAQRTEASGRPAAPGGQRAARGAAAPSGALAGPQRVVSELTQARLLRAVLSERQLQEVLVDFWFNHFNVFVGKGMVRQHLTAYERDAIRPHVLGNFRQLLGAVAHSPAMLIYLDNWQSAAPGERGAGAPARPGRRGIPTRPGRAADSPAARPRRGLNENYARELMELHTLGVDGGYTQQDVVELARILTGWTIDRPAQGGRFVFRPAMHDAGTKTLLGVRFTASGKSEGDRALDLLARHPSTSRHVAFKLAQRFVADEPPAALVDRAAGVFRDTHGDLRAVVGAIVTSPEFFAPEARRAKVKTPLEFVVSAVRATGATVATAQPLVAALRTLGMPLYGAQPPTGYGATADAWVNTGALLSRMTFALQLANGGRGAAARPATRPAATTRGAAGRMPMVIDLERLAPDARAASRDQVIASLLGGQASEATRAALGRAEDPRHLVALALGSPEFQRR